MGDLDDLCDAINDAIGVEAWQTNTEAARAAVATLRARVEAAELEATRAKSDAYHLTGLWFNSIRPEIFAELQEAGLTAELRKAARFAVDPAGELSAGEVIDILQRALGDED